MDQTPPVARGAHAVITLLKRLAFLGLGLLLAVPVLALMPGVELQGLFLSPPYGPAFVPTLLATVSAAAFVSGVIAPWCNSLLRTVAASFLVSQLVAIPIAIQLTLNEPLPVVITWAVFTAIASAAVAKYLRLGDYLVQDNPV